MRGEHAGGGRGQALDVGHVPPGLRVGELLGEEGHLRLACDVRLMINGWAVGRLCVVLCGAADRARHNQAKPTSVTQHTRTEPTWLCGRT